MSHSQNIGRSLVWFLGCILAVGILSGCSGASSDDESLDASSGDNGGEIAKDDAAEGNGQENFANSGDGGGSAGADVNSDTSAGGEDLGAADPGAGGAGATGNAGGGNALFGNANAAATPPTDASLNQPANAAISNATAGNPPLNNSGGNASVPANAPVAANAAAISRPSGSAGGITPVAQATPSAMAPRSDGRVRYVKEGGVQIVNAPNGSPVANLEQGDHPVTWEENGWLKLADGMYVPVDGLSNKGVGRSRAARAWTH